MRVLVTGATTPVGDALVTTLLAAADVELVFAVGAEQEPAFATGTRLIYRSADLRRPRVMHDLMWADARDHGIDVVIHGMHHRCTGDRGLAVRAQNVDATRELVLGCRNHPTIRRLVYRSFAEVYALGHGTPSLLDEEAPLDFEHREQWLHDRIEADLAVSTAAGGSLGIAVLRCAEILVPDNGSQLLDYLQSKVCLRPLGFDPMINVLSLEDAVAAFVLAARSTATGVFNIPGLDTLPLSNVIELYHRAQIPVPGPLLPPLYGLRRLLTGFEFRYGMNAARLHFGGVLDGTRARDELGYTPRTRVTWPQPWWRILFSRLAADRLDRPQ